MTMKDGFNLKALFPSYDGKDFSQYNFIGDRIILCVFSIFICLVGLAGNGNIIWLLGFRMKREPFAIYVLNLAVADFGSLVFLLPLHIFANRQYFQEVLEFGFTLIRLLTSLFQLIRHLLLAAISVDRSVSVLFPKCYQYHQSPVWSTIVCAFIWALPFAFYGVMLILFSLDLTPGYLHVFSVGYIVTTLICLSLVIISTLTLFITVCLKSQPCQGGNLSKAILLILLSFLLSTIPTHVFPIVFHQVGLSYFGFWTSLQSSINPLIYFLAGRRDGGKFQQRMTVVLQRVFKEERNTGTKWPPRTQTSNL